MDDEDIVDGIINNDHNCFRELYTKYFSKLTLYSIYRLHSIEIAQDLVQDLFVKVWINRHNLDRNKSIKAYLYKSLINMMISLKRLHSFSNLSLDSTSLKLHHFEEVDLNRLIDVRMSVDRLPGKLKAVFELSRIEGFSYKEIAEICGISVKAVEKRMSKVFVILRKKLS